jgi:outer membrane usher protein
MASRSIKLCRSAISLASALLLQGIAAASPDPAPEPVMDPSGLTVIADRASASIGQDLYLEVILNGNPTHQIAHFVHDGHRLHASADTLHQLGFRVPARDGDSSLDLESLPGVTFHYDEERQRVEIIAPPALLDQATAVLNTTVATVPQPQSSPGVLLNYDFYGTRDNSDNLGVSAFAELRLFNEWGVLSNTALSRATDSPGSGWGADTVRLDTTFSRSFVDSATTLRIGDAISGNLGWTRATRFGGIQLQRNFALQPDLITFPIPAFYGQASLPSTVDLYINGLKQYSSPVPAGPFQLNTTPIVNGNGQAQVVITDAMGRQSSLDFSFYTANQLLRAGLSDYSLEAGFVRKGYGVSSFSYANDPAASGTYRYGVVDWLTLETHAEASAGLANVGGGGVVEVGRAGIVNTSFAASQDHGSSGSQAELGYTWRNDRFNLALDSTRTFGSYRDVASTYGRAPPQRSNRLLAGVMLGRAGSLGMSYVEQQYRGELRSRFASAYYFRSLGSRCSFNLSANQNLDDHSERSVFAGLTFSFDSGTSVGVSAQHDSRGNALTLDASRPINPDGGFGWHARAQDSDSTHGGQAEIGYRAEQGQLLAGVENRDGATRAYADATGALVFMDSQFFFARHIDDAFAVVSTNGVAGVPVTLENRPIGKTDVRGDLLVTPLNSYQRNKIAIDPMQLPADVRIDRVDAQVTPSDRAGTLVRFGIESIRAASIILHDVGGKPLAVGSLVGLHGKPASSSVVGYDGVVYLEGLAESNTLDVQTPTGACATTFDYRARAQTVPVIGPLVCTRNHP